MKAKNIIKLTLSLSLLFCLNNAYAIWQPTKNRCSVKFVNTTITHKMFFNSVMIDTLLDNGIAPGIHKQFKKILKENTEEYPQEIVDDSLSFINLLREIQVKKMYEFHNHIIFRDLIGFVKQSMNKNKNILDTNGAQLIATRIKTIWEYANTIFQQMISQHQYTNILNVLKLLLEEPNKTIINAFITDYKLDEKIIENFPLYIQRNPDDGFFVIQSALESLNYNLTEDEWFVDLVLKLSHIAIPHLTTSDQCSLILKYVTPLFLSNNNDSFLDDDIFKNSLKIFEEIIKKNQNTLEIFKIAKSNFNKKHQEHALSLLNLLFKHAQGHAYALLTAQNLLSSWFSGDARSQGLILLKEIINSLVRSDLSRIPMGQQIAQQAIALATKSKDTEIKNYARHLSQKIKN